MPAGCQVWADDCLATLHLGRENTGEEEDTASGMCVDPGSPRASGRQLEG